MKSPFGEQKLILGGHSFIAPLGSDPAASPEEQHEIVAECLNRGITTFDTTYAPERVGWARAIAALPNSSNATPILWNFFGHPAHRDPLPGPTAWDEAGWDKAREELDAWEGRIALVMHPVDAENAAQLATVQRWKAEGRIAALGVWTSLQGNPDHRDRILSGWQWVQDHGDAWDFVVTPKNLACGAINDPIFDYAREVGWTTLATSPFERGWELDRRVDLAVRRGGTDPAATRAHVAGAMLRHVAFSPGVDHVIVAMRAPAYVAANLAAVAAGPLAPDEADRLHGLV